MANETIEFLPGMIVGNGFDNTTGDIKITPAVKGSIGRIQGNANGQSGEFTFRITSTIEEFEKALSIEAQAKYGYPRFRKGVEGKFSFAKNLKISEDTVCLVMSLNVQNAVETYNRGVSLSNDARSLLELKKEKRFRERFGSHFISGVHTGGEFHAVFQIEKSHKTESKDLATKIHGAYGPFRASGNINRSVQKSISSESVIMSIFQKGGTVEPVFTMEDMFKRCLHISKEINRDRSVPFAVLLEDYKELELPGDNVSWVHQQHAENVMKVLGRKYQQLEKVINKIDYILYRHPEYYQNVNEALLSRALDDIAERLNEITTAADQCIRDFSKCKLIDVSIPNIVWPKKRPNRKQKWKGRQGGIVGPKAKSGGQMTFEEYAKKKSRATKAKSMKLMSRFLSKKK